MARLLLIDDDEKVLSAMSRVLRGAGHSVMCAKNGREGFAMFEAERPELVITDVHMPDQDGLETIQAIRASDPSMPIIAASGGGSLGLDLLPVAKMLGAKAYLEKPFRAEELIQMVASTLAVPGFAAAAGALTPMR